MKLSQLKKVTYEEIKNKQYEKLREKILSCILKKADSLSAIRRWRWTANILMCMRISVT